MAVNLIDSNDIEVSQTGSDIKLNIANGIKITKIPLSFSTSGSNILLNYTIGDTDSGIIFINGNPSGGNNIFLSVVINYATRYSTEIISSKGANVSTPTLTNNNKTLQLTFTGTTIPTGIGTVSAVLIQTN